MKNLKRLSSVVIGSLFLAAGSVQAEEGLQSYVGGSYGLTDVLDDNFSGSNDPNPDIMIFRAGVHLSNYVSLELRGGVNLGLHDTGNSKISNLYGFYLKPEMPLSNTFSVNFVAGYGAMQYQNENSVKSRGDSFSYGVGLSWLLFENTALTADFARVFDEKDLSVDTFVVGASYFFEM